MTIRRVHRILDTTGTVTSFDDYNGEDYRYQSRRYKVCRKGPRWYVWVSYRQDFGEPWQAVRKGSTIFH